MSDINFNSYTASAAYQNHTSRLTIEEVALVGTDKEIDEYIEIILFKVPDDRRYCFAEIVKTDFTIRERTSDSNIATYSTGKTCHLLSATMWDDGHLKVERMEFTRLFKLQKTALINYVTGTDIWLK